MGRQERGRMLEKTAQLPCLSNDQEPSFHQDDYKVRTSHLFYIKATHKQSRKERLTSRGLVVWKPQRNYTAKHNSWDFTSTSCMEVIHFCLCRLDAWMKVITNMECAQEAWAKWGADMRSAMQPASSLRVGRGPQESKRKVPGFRGDRDAWKVSGSREQGVVGDREHEATWFCSIESSE